MSPPLRAALTPGPRRVIRWNLKGAIFAVEGLVNETPLFLSERLLQEGQKTLEFFQRLSLDQWGQMIYTDGAEWRVRDVLAHFVAAEDGIRRLIENILAGGGGSPLDFGLDAYNQRKVSGLKDTPEVELMQRFAALRRQSAELVASLSQDDLARVGRHPWLGAATLGEIIKLLYRHNQIHQRDIRKALGE